MHRTSAQLTITTSQAKLKLGQKNYFWDLKKKPAGIFSTCLSSFAAK